MTLPPVTMADAALRIQPLAATVGAQAVTKNLRTTVSAAVPEGMKLHSRIQQMSWPFSVF